MISVKIKEPETYITKAEMSVAVGAALIAFLCTVPIPDPFTGGFLNSIMLAAIPSQVAMMAWILPPAIYCAFVVNAQIRFNDRIKLYHQEVERATMRQIIFRCQLRHVANLSIWSIRNCNNFVWTGAKVLLEKRVGERVENEKHQLGVVASGESVEVESKLAPEETAQWRLMVVTAQGTLIDFPDLPLKNPYEAELGEPNQEVLTV